MQDPTTGTTKPNNSTGEGEYPFTNNQTNQTETHNLSYYINEHK